MSASSKKKLRKEQNAATMTEKQQKELKEAKQLKAMTLTFAVVMILVVAIVVGVALRTPVNSIINRNTVAVTVGDHDLSVVDLSYHYIDQVGTYYNNVYNTYYSSFGDYWQLFLPFDTGTPLNEQMYSEEEGTTWADYFMDKAFKSVKQVYGLYDLAVSDGHELTETEQENLESYEENFELYAKLYGYSDAGSYLRSTYGSGANLESYMEYYRVSTIASSYAEAYADALEYTDDDYRAHEKGNFNNYSTFDFAVYQITVEDYLPEKTESEDTDSDATETTGAAEDDEPTTEELAAALEAAKKDADALVAGEYASVVEFDKAIAALEINAGATNAASTQYDDYFYEKISVTDIQKWVGNANRTEGELTSIAITKTVTNDDESTTLETTGYYVVYFGERNDNYTNLVDIRHVLIAFEGGTTDSTTGETTYTDEQKAAAKEEAEKLLAEWQAGDATEDTFAELANKNSDDSDGTDGGLYEEVYPGQMVENFNDWCFDESRQPGDTGIVETEYGYHIMYFVQTDEINYRDYLIREELVSEDTNAWIDSVIEATTLTEVDLSRMAWDYTIG